MFQITLQLDNAQVTEKFEEEKERNIRFDEVMEDLDEEIAINFWFDNKYINYNKYVWISKGVVR